MVFHFKTTKCDPDKTLIDDSKTLGNPMELVLGKQFKLEVWEAIVQQMSLNEVATFTCEKSVRMFQSLSQRNTNKNISSNSSWLPHIHLYLKLSEKLANQNQINGVIAVAV